MWGEYWVFKAIIKIEETHSFRKKHVCSGSPPTFAPGGVCGKCCVLQLIIFNCLLPPYTTPPSHLRNAVYTIYKRIRTFLIYIWILFTITRTTTKNKRERIRTTSAQESLRKHIFLSVENVLQNAPQTYSTLCSSHWSMCAISSIKGERRVYSVSKCYTLNPYCSVSMKSCFVIARWPQVCFVINITK